MHGICFSRARWESSVPGDQRVPWGPLHTHHRSLQARCPPVSRRRTLLGLLLSPKANRLVHFTPVTLMFLSLGQKPRCGILGCWEGRRGGEQGRGGGQNERTAPLAPPHCLSRLCVWTACKNYATPNISFTSKRFWKSSPSSEAELPWASPTLVLNQAFICLPIGTDAKCP